MGLRREWIVAIRSSGMFHPDDSEPMVSSTLCGFLHEHISLSMLCVTKQSIFFMHGARESDTEARLHLLQRVRPHNEGSWRRMYKCLTTQT